MSHVAQRHSGSVDALLGDSPSRDYAGKLALWNDFAEPELRRLIAGLGLRAGMRVLDAGCGTGGALPLLFAEVGTTGRVIGWDLSDAHVAAARRFASSHIEIQQCDLMSAEPIPGGVDFIWCINTLNHFSDPVRAVDRLATLLRAGGRIAVGQSSVLADMYFAWDARLERLVNEAVRRYYRDKYGLRERDLTAVRALVGSLRSGGLQEVAAHSVLIERASPLDPATQRYLTECIFAATWGERLKPYLDADDFAELDGLCDPAGPNFALRRPDFHFLQTLTLVTARRG